MLEEKISSLTTAVNNLTSAILIHAKKGGSVGGTGSTSTAVDSPAENKDETIETAGAKKKRLAAEKRVSTAAAKKAAAIGAPKAPTPDDLKLACRAKMGGAPDRKVAHADLVTMISDIALSCMGDASVKVDAFDDQARIELGAKIEAYEPTEDAPIEEEVF